MVDAIAPSEAAADPEARDRLGRERNQPAERAGSSRFLPHVPGLDGIRGVAILLVCTTHLFAFFVTDKLSTWLAGGFLGVEIFFVLSGFLITALLLNENRRRGNISFRAFYARRALRLLPALVAMLAVYLVYTVVTDQDLGIQLRSTWVEAFYVTNWAAALNYQITNSHLWSLAVEEQFYFVWPLITALLLAWHWTRRWTIAIISIAIVGLTIWTAILWTPRINFFTLDELYARTDVQAVPLLIGALAAHLWTRGLTPRGFVRALAVPSAALIAVCAWTLEASASFYWHGGLALVSLATAVVILAVVDGGWRAMSWSPLRAIGRVSYGIYLWHIPVFYAVSQLEDNLSAGVNILLASVVTAGFTIASWYLVEKPFLRLKRRVAR